MNHSINISDVQAQLIAELLSKAAVAIPQASEAADLFLKISAIVEKINNADHNTTNV